MKETGEVVSVFLSETLSATPRFGIRTKTAAKKVLGQAPWILKIIQTELRTVIQFLIQHHRQMFFVCYFLLLFFFYFIPNHCQNLYSLFRTKKRKNILIRYSRGLRDIDLKFRTIYRDKPILTEKLGQGHKSLI